MLHCAQILAVALVFSGTAALAADRKLDKTAKIDGVAAEIAGEVGGLKVLKVEVKNLPDAAELALVQAKEPNKTCRARVSVDFENPSNVKLDAKFAWELLDEKGGKLTSCKKEATVDPRSKPDYKICLADDIKCLDAPKIHSVHLVATTEDAELTLDRDFPFQGAIAEVNQKLGDISVDKVFADRAPNAKDLEKAKNHPADTSHPYVNLLLSNPSDSKVIVNMRVVLLDKEGGAIATCEKGATVKAHVRSNDYTVCQPTVPTADWPKITTARVTVAIKKGWF